ncbi:aminotransferase class IV [Hyphomonas atlantica]|uniref:aminotransferase class IV n=1 Tax=Hyphomonas atlantica TaxID=1280948 RepID=UPI002356FC06|nr:aminotransferase class IV [Hyphomonas atlantica]|tara:strand:- start:338 stop:1150 length:813 start_codon:yes stop_codon:yes gene_type:complete
MNLFQPSSSPVHSVSFDVRDRGLLLADGVFDTSLVVRGQIMMRDAHIDRLLDGAVALGIPLQRSQVEGAMDQAAPPESSGALRVTVTRGAGGRGLAGEVSGGATILANLTDYDVSVPLPAVHVQESEILRNPTSINARHKTLSYTDNVVALRAAVSSGFGDAFFFSPGGNLSCATAANVFVQLGRDIVTSPIDDGALPGVIRNWVLERGYIGEFVVSERSVSRSDLLAADRVFLTNSLRLFQPVSGFEATHFEPLLPEGCEALRSQLIGR